MLHLSSTSFDAATFEIWGALANGARLVVGPPGRSRCVELGRLLRAHGVTTAFFTTGLFHLMVDERLDDLAGVRQLLTGGDVMSPAAARAAALARPGCRLINGYGPTEVTTFTTCYEVRVAGRRLRLVPIGRPISRHVGPAARRRPRAGPDGTPGQLYAGGDGLARGYLGDPAMTADRFVPDPWLRRAAAVPHGRPGRDAARRHAGVPRPGRSAGQAARFPVRAGRDRGRHSAATPSCATLS